MHLARCTCTAQQLNLPAGNPFAAGGAFGPGNNPALIIIQYVKQAVAILTDPAAKVQLQLLLLLLCFESRLRLVEIEQKMLADLLKSVSQLDKAEDAALVNAFRRSFKQVRARS